MRDITTPVSARTNGLRPAALAALVGLLLVLSAGAPTRDGESDSAAGRVHSSAELAEAEAWFRAHATKLTEREIADASEAVAEGARATGLEVGLILAVIQVESGGDPFALSAVGAVGLMQLRPSTAEEMAGRLGLPWEGPVSLTDPSLNIRLGTAYLRSLVDRFGDVEEALSAYAWGPRRVRERMVAGDPVPDGYARRVEAAFGGPLARGARFL